MTTSYRLIKLYEVLSSSLANSNNNLHITAVQTELAEIAEKQGMTKLAAFHWITASQYSELPATKVAYAIRAISLLHNGPEHTELGAACRAVYTEIPREHWDTTPKQAWDEANIAYAARDPE